MNNEIRNLEPKVLWNHFADLNNIPRASKKEEKVIEFMVNFGTQLNLETLVDSVGNVVIKKPATKGFENRKIVVLQSHLDMVHQKNANTLFNFDTDAIKMKVNGDWVTADGTTLGADNGIGVAAIMAILSSKNIEHGPLEALFTIDEETGMTGAMGLSSDILKGEILLNLDTEEDDEIGIGCAGGIDVTAKRKYTEIPAPKNSTSYLIAIKGLSGGHSGMDIHKGLGNANKIMNRILYFGYKNFNLNISEIDGGSLRNAIPRESNSKVLISKDLKKDFIEKINSFIIDLKNEYILTDPKLDIQLKEIDDIKNILEPNAQAEFLKCIYAAHNGVFKMSTNVSGLVETSNNIARVIVKNGNMEIRCLTRSSSEISKLDLVNSLQSAFDLSNFSIRLDNDYPGWQPNSNSEILKIATAVYTNLYKTKPLVSACHAGLECGIIGKHYPKMDMISFGPTILGAHSPDERVKISSTLKFWKYLKAILLLIQKNKTNY